MSDRPGRFVAARQPPCSRGVSQVFPVARRQGATPGSRRAGRGSSRLLSDHHHPVHRNLQGTGVPAW
ncbi:hypothetical protein SBD_5449 [Streptomyces bottropensis ATCC 25435]|uniref:Uncharacterized protein n=1 Tax=Streptomyces bottropensis ATCC 25435 TaxID=1054862 RepID=M3FLT7_9ACTN|nr:hypothetical protein SBD_5449 [Streptomyces bottropensis ATCC 25435]